MLLFDKLQERIILVVVRLTDCLATFRTAEPVRLPHNTFYWITGRLTNMSLPNHKEAYNA